MRSPKYWSFSFSLSPFFEHSGLTSFRTDWFDLLAVQGTLKSLSSTTVKKYQFFSSWPFFVVNLYIFKLKDSCFTELCWFLLNINMNQPQVYICSLPLECSSLLYGPTLTSVNGYWKNHSFDYIDLYLQSDVSAF